MSADPLSCLNNIKTTTYLKNIRTTAYLENIRMLFDFMQELHYRYRKDTREKPRYVGYRGNGGLSRRSELLKKLQNHIHDVTQECLDPNQDTDALQPQLLYQHPLSSYLSFYLRLFPLRHSHPDTAGAVGEQLAPMLNYFNILQFLTDEEFALERESPDHHASLPYIYEDLCLSIREMTGCHACFLLYREKGEFTELIARSGYVIDGEKGLLSNFNIKAPELDSIIKQCSLKDVSSGGTDPNQITYQASRLAIPPSNLTFSSAGTLVEGIHLVHGTCELGGGESSKHQYLVFELPYFSEGHQHENDRSFYLLLDYNSLNLPDITAAKVPALKVLFLRKRLWEALRQDYAELIDYRFDCSYIKPVQEGSKPAILHISDSHLIDDKSWDNGKSKILCEQLKSQHWGKIDLLAVTGDIVLASRHASDAQAKYHRIGQLLQNIAISLWSTDQILPHDWKRRIMIVTGNHDYAAMNDVSVETGGRRIKNAGPAGHSGGTMSKFTYYIEFLINFLDAPIDELLENDLNEIRDYKYLGLTVAMINTSSKANSLQNNKVTINIEKVQRLIQQAPWHNSDQERSYVALMHHAPSYTINYFKDKYEIQKYLSKGEDSLTLELYNRYEALLKDTCSQWLNIPAPDDAVQDLIKEIQGLLESNNGNAKGFMKSELKSDMAMLVNIRNAPDLKDEFRYDFMSKSITLCEIQEYDQKQFDKACGQLFGKDRTIILCCHEHKNQYCNHTANPVFIIGRLHNRSKAGAGEGYLSYLVVTPDTTSDPPAAAIYQIPLGPPASSAHSCACPCEDFFNRSSGESCSSRCPV